MVNGIRVQNEHDCVDCRQLMDFPQGELARAELQYAMWSPTGSSLVRITTFYVDSRFLVY